MQVWPAVHQGQDILKMTPEIITYYLFVMDPRLTTVGKRVRLPGVEKGHRLIEQLLLFEALGLADNGIEQVGGISSFKQDTLAGDGSIEIPALSEQGINGLSEPGLRKPVQGHRPGIRLRIVRAGHSLRTDGPRLRVS